MVVFCVVTEEERGNQREKGDLPLALLREDRRKEAQARDQKVKRAYKNQSLDLT